MVRYLAIRYHHKTNFVDRYTQEDLTYENWVDDSQFNHSTPLEVAMIVDKELCKTRPKHNRAACKPYRNGREYTPVCP